MDDDSADSQCGFVFDPDQRTNSTGESSHLTAEDLNNDGQWRCPHNARAGHDMCIFHAPVKEKSDDTVRAAFRDQLAQSGKRDKQFIGANFGSLTLPSVSLDSSDNHPIDLRHITVHGETTLEDAIIQQPLWLDGATFHQRANFNSTTFNAEFYCSDVKFSDRSWFNGASFTQGAWFYATTFQDAEFSMSWFGDRADFREATFSHTHFREATFDGRVEFHKARFENAMFAGAQCRGLMYFDKATLPDHMNCRHASFEATVSFEDVTLTEDTCYIDLRDATLPAGRLHQPSTGQVLYDLADAVVGDVSLTDDVSPVRLLERYRFLNTTFDGFDFGRYRQQLRRSNWDIHTFESVPGFEEAQTTNPSSGEIENTYLKAKNGASSIGDTAAAAEFFRKEMLFRRSQYRSHLADTEQKWRTRAVAVFRYGANTILELTTGYGERPSRTVVTSVVVILVFAIALLFGRGQPAYGHPAGTLVLSLESFVGLIHGGGESVENPWIRALTAGEGFIGAFLIALFVFTLTRSIHR